MILNYIKVFFRTFSQRKASMLAHIAGLGIALTGCIFIILFVTDEFKYDRFNEKRERIFRYTEQSIAAGQQAVIIPACNYPLITDGLAGFEDGFRIMRSENKLILASENKYVEDVFYADNGIFNVMTFPLLKGDARTALAAPYSIVVNEDIAKKYFGQADPLGKTISIEKSDYKITGLMKNIPAASHIKPAILISIVTLNVTQPRLMTDWHISSCFFYFMMKPETNYQTFAAAVSRRVAEKYGSEWASKNKTVLQPLPEVYLHPTGSPWDIVEHGDISNVKSFLIIAVLILLMSSFNYTNYLTASLKIREKETAARKILGAGRRNIIAQYIAETLLSFIIAILLAIVMVIALLDKYNLITGKNISPLDLFSSEILLPVTAILIVVSVLSSVYPALLAFKTSPLNVARMNARSVTLSVSKYTMGFRQIVTSIQFLITVTLMICAFVIYQQLKFANTEKLGFNKNRLLTIENPWGEKMYDNYELYRQAIIKYPEVESVSAAGNNPSENVNNYTFLFPKGGNPKETVNCAQIAVDFDILQTWQTKLLQGRGFSREIDSDKDFSVIINKAAVDALGLKNPLESEIDGVNNSGGPQKIIGVVEDMHFKSFKEKVMPLLLYVRPWGASNIVIRLGEGRPAETLAKLEREWNALMPEQPFIYHFVDEAFDKLYHSEQRTEKLIIIFSGFAMVIALLGLFSLISLISQTRRKEIGIRKVLGATASGISAMMLKEYIFIFAAANIIAWPAALYVTSKWLEDYAYRISISWEMFVVPAVIVFIIGLAVIGWQIIKTSSANPAESLKYE